MTNCSSSDPSDTDGEPALVAARSLVLSEKFQDAENYLDEVLQEYPYNACLWTLLGDVKAELDLVEESLHCYTTAIGLDPCALEAMWKKANVMLGEGDLPKAEQQARDALGKMQRLPERSTMVDLEMAYDILVNCLLQQDRNEDALACAREGHGKTGSDVLQSHIERIRTHI